MTPKSRALAIQTYSFSDQDHLLIDANVWLSVYGPQADAKDWRTSMYSAALKRIIAADCTVFSDVLIISEFVNRYSRLESRLRGIHPDSFKTFRQSAKFKLTAKAIAEDLRRILEHCRPIESGFDQMDLDACLDRYENECPDFNDMVLVEICQRNQLKLVTHDSDFRSCPITILTANPRLLRSN
jgi:predicted nucleic acid-binding protein